MPRRLLLVLMLSGALVAPATAAVPRAHTTITERTPAGLGLRLTVRRHHRGRLSVSCPSGQSLGTSRTFKISAGGAFRAVRRSEFAFSGHFDTADHVMGHGQLHAQACGGGLVLSEGPVGQPQWTSCPASSPESPLVPDQTYPFAGVLPNAALGTLIRVQFTDPDSSDGTPVTVDLRTDDQGRFATTHAFGPEDHVYGADALAYHVADPVAPAAGCEMQVQ